MLEALQVVGDSDDHEYSLTEVSFMNSVFLVLIFSINARDTQLFYF